MTRSPFALAIPLALLLAGAAHAADTSPRSVELTVHGASILHTTDNGDPHALLASNIPPDAFFQVYVDENLIYASNVVLNSYEPQWNEGCSFFARWDSKISFAVLEADPDGDIRLLALWEGPLTAVKKAAGTLRFGPVQRFSYFVRIGE